MLSVMVTKEGAAWPLDCFSWLAKANLAAFSCSLANLFSYLETFLRVGLMNLPFMSLTEIVSSLIWRSRRMTSRWRKNISASNLYHLSKYPWQIFLRSSCLRLLPSHHGFGLLDVDPELVEWPRHLGEGNDELLVAGDGHIVPVLIGPMDAEVRRLDLGKDHLELAHQVVVAGAGSLVNHKPPHLLLLLLASFQIDFERYVVSHCVKLFQITCKIIL